jgi:hypothetical protein
MKDSWWPTSTGLESLAKISAAWGAMFPIGVIVAVLGKDSTLGVVVAALGLPGLIAAFLFTVAAAVAKRREQRAASRKKQAARARAAAERLRLPVRPVREVSAYDVGVDTESPQARAAAGGGDHPPYVARELDGVLHSALTEAITRGGASLIVLEGLSKVGKSRTLFEAAREALPDAQLVAPQRDAESLLALLEPGGQPQLSPDAPVVLWLDDLEMFVTAGHGLDDRAMDRLSSWGRPVIALATYGGKGQRHLDDKKLADPVNELLDRWAQETRFLLSGALRPSEQAAAREANYAPEAVDAMSRGIGEYMVAAPRLERKLTTARHEPGAEPCAEGVAVVWAAIDWQRAGMTKPISEELLHELYPNYLTGLDPTDERFRRGLEWALEPLYASVALLRHAGSFLPYDWIVAYADQKLDGEINPNTWDHILDISDAEAALGPRARRACKA